MLREQNDSKSFPQGFWISLPHAQDTETRPRILTILGVLEVTYDSAMARATTGHRVEDVNWRFSGFGFGEIQKLS